MSEEKIKYIVEPDESRCIALKVRSTIVYAYPLDARVLRTNPKVVTRTGALVKRVRVAHDGDEELIIGELDGETLTWGIDGTFEGDASKSLYVYERYWDTKWNEKIKLSHGDWAIKYQRHHDAPIPMTDQK